MNYEHLPMNPDHAIAGIMWLQEISAHERWDLSVDEIAVLLGGIEISTYQDWASRASAGQSIDLDRDCLERISVLLGIFEALQLTVPSCRADLAYRWFNTPNDHLIMGGLSIKEYLLERKSIEGLYTVRRFLIACRG